MNPMKALIRALSAIAFLVCGLRADDTSVGVMLPGLRSEPSGSVAVVSSVVALRSGQVELALKTAVARPQGASLIIKMPRFGFLGEPDPYPDRHFPELEVRLNGTQAQFQSSAAVFVGPSDVTGAVRKAGLDPFAIADTPPFVSSGPNEAAAMETLVKLGAVEKDGENYVAKWQVQRTVTIAIPSGSVTVALNYKARPAFALKPAAQIANATNAARYCVSSQTIENTTRIASRMLVAREYAIAATIDDKATKVGVTIGASDKAGTVAMFCGVDGKAVAGNAATLQGTGRADSNGVLRVLTLSSPGPAR